MTKMPNKRSEDQNYLLEIFRDAFAISIPSKNDNDSRIQFQGPKWLIIQ